MSKVPQGLKPASLLPLQRRPEGLRHPLLNNVA